MQHGAAGVSAAAAAAAAAAAMLHIPDRLACCVSVCAWHMEVSWGVLESGNRHASGCMQSNASCLTAAAVLTQHMYAHKSKCDVTAMVLLVLLLLLLQAGLRGTPLRP